MVCISVSQCTFIHYHGLTNLHNYLYFPFFHFDTTQNSKCLLCVCVIPSRKRRTNYLLYFGYVRFIMEHSYTLLCRCVLILYHNEEPPEQHQAILNAKIFKNICTRKNGNCIYFHIEIWLGGRNVNNLRNKKKEMRKKPYEKKENNLIREICCILLFLILY